MYIILCTSGLKNDSSAGMYALKIDVWQHRSKAGLIVHSDVGSQYASNVYRHLLKAHDFVGSLSRKRNCWDNSVAESFFGSLKQERVQWRNY
jgi:putative transposase